MKERHRKRRKPPPGQGQRLPKTTCQAGKLDKSENRFPPAPRQPADNWQPVGEVVDRLVDALRFQRQVEHLHSLGPRPVGELLKELVDHSGGSDFMEARLAAFAALDPGVVRALGGDQFPPMLTLVQP